MSLGASLSLGTGPLQALQAARDAHERQKRERGIDITVIDSSDLVGLAAAWTRLGDIKITGVEDMVEKVLAARGSYPVRRLNILDHGNPNMLQIGDRWIDTESLPHFAPTLAKLRPAFHARGFVHLQHCQIGLNTDLMAGLAALWNVPVYAGTGNQVPVYRFNWGEYVRVDPDGRSCPSGRPGVDAGCE